VKFVITNVFEWHEIESDGELNLSMLRTTNCFNKHVHGRPGDDNLSH